MAIGLLYGGTGADILLTDADSDDIPEFASGTYTAWTTRTGATQITELYTYPAQAATTTVTVQTATGDEGRVMFYGPSTWDGPIWLRNEAHTSYTRWLVLPSEDMATRAGITDHGALGGLGDDDHTQYYNTARGDARWLRSSLFTAAKQLLASTAAGTASPVTGTALQSFRVNAAGTAIEAYTPAGSVNTSDFALKSGVLGQFSDVADAAPTVDDSALLYDIDTSTWNPVDLTDRFAGVGADGRLAQADWPVYFVPTIVLNEGQAVPAAFPPNGLVWVRPAAAAAAPADLGGNAGSAITSTNFSLSTNVAVGDYIIVGVVSSAEAGLTSFTGAVGGGGVTFTEVSPHVQGTVVSSRLLVGRATAAIAGGTTLTVTHAGGVRSDIAIRGARASGLVSPVASAIDLTSTGGAGSAQNFATNPTATATSQANELVFGCFGWNPNGLTYAPSGGFTQVGAISQSSDTSPRACVLQYKELTTGQIVSSTGVTAPTGAAATSAHSGTLVTLRKS